MSGNAPHTGVTMGTAFLAFFEHLQLLVPPERPRGYAGSRHGFTVRRARFQAAIERLKSCNVPYEGPIAHPENSPFGESVYLADPGGNFYEICWRRDREEEWERGTSMAGKV